jgi:hypothetical protein
MAASAAASSRAHPSRPGSEKKRAIVLHTFVVIHEHSFGFGLFRSFTKIFRSASATSHGRRPVPKSALPCWLGRARARRELNMLGPACPVSQGMYTYMPNA